MSPVQKVLRPATPRLGVLVICALCVVLGTFLLWNVEAGDVGFHGFLNERVELKATVEEQRNTIDRQTVEIRDAQRAAAASAGGSVFNVLTAAGFVAKTLCEGLFVSNRTFDSVWNFDACIYNCLAQKIFNLEDPANSLGQLSIDSTRKFVNASVAGFPTSAVYLGENFGCQLNPADKGPVVPVYVDDGEPYSGKLDWPMPKTHTCKLRGGIFDVPCLPNIFKWSFKEEIDYDGLNTNIARWFENPYLVEGAKTRAICVIYKGKLIAEQYSDAQEYKASTPSLSWSMAKSVTSTLIGIRTGDSDFSVGQLVTSPIWDAAETAIRNITVADLLQMTSGIGWDEPNSIGPLTGELLFEAYDSAAFAASFPQRYMAGAYWNYSTANYNILQYNLRKSFKSDSDYWSYAQNNLFKKIGARSFTFEADPSGTLLGGSHVFATARDWARFGQLFMQDGVWEGERILPKGWVKYITTPGPYPGYGAGIWLGYPGAPRDTYVVNGVLGQRVINTPSSDLVIVHLGLNFDISFDAAYGEEFYTDIASKFPKSNVPLTSPDMLSMTF